MPLPQLTETTIQQYATPQIFARGRDYYQQGRVTSLIVRGPTLYAEVEGSEEFPYLVLCTFDTDGPIEASCTCPYEWGGLVQAVASGLTQSGRAQPGAGGNH